jgi:hypothetical protein
LLTVILLYFLSGIFFLFVDLIDALRDRSIFLSVENEGLRERIESLEIALSSMRKRFDSSNKKYKNLSLKHSKCASKQKIMFLYC